MRCTAPYKDKEGNLFPCGQCMPCKINRTREWTFRLLQEYDAFHQKGLFITLTYDDEHLPDNLSLRKRDFQLFMKRFRKRLNGRFIRYFACGEYGLKRGRPHYHAIIFNVDMFDKQDIIDSWPYCDWNALMYDPRGRGQKAIAYVSHDSIRYVCGYVQKKIYGKGKDYYTNQGIEPPFQLQSQNLGLSYLEKNVENILINKGVPYKGQIIPIPRYYKKKIRPNRYVTNFGDLFSDYMAERATDDWKNYQKMYEIGWNMGLRGHEIKDWINAHDTVEYNYSIKFALSGEGEF